MSQPSETTRDLHIGSEITQNLHIETIQRLLISSIYHQKPML